MNWEQLCDDPVWENIPYRVELTRHNQLLLTPRRSYHSIFQSRIIRGLNQLLSGGTAMPECPIETRIGTIVADVAWASPEKIKRNIDLAAWTESPEIVIEVLSPSNAREEIHGKRDAVFALGALEFWVCDRKGRIEFFDSRGKIGQSRLCPEFPASVAAK